jgi:hypothetical protein
MPAREDPFDVTRLVKPAQSIVGASCKKEAAMTDVTIYISEPDDAIARLAQLDSARRPRCAVLVAAVHGHAVAALPLDGGPAIADPFQPTAELVSLLEIRLAQLTSHSRPRRPVRLLEALRLPVRSTQA